MAFMRNGEKRKMNGERTKTVSLVEVIMDETGIFCLKELQEGYDKPIVFSITPPSLLGVERVRVNHESSGRPFEQRLRDAIYARCQDNQKRKVPYYSRAEGYYVSRPVEQKDVHVVLYLARS